LSAWKVFNLIPFNVSSQHSLEGGLQTFLIKTPASLWRRDGDSAAEKIGSFKLV
jgi:hypothetical protein